MPGVVAGVPGLGRDTTQGDEDFGFEPVLRRPEHTLPEAAQAEELPIGQDADPVDRPAQRQCQPPRGRPRDRRSLRRTAGPSLQFTAQRSGTNAGGRSAQAAKVGPIRLDPLVAFGLLPGQFEGEESMLFYVCPYSSASSGPSSANAFRPANSSNSPSAGVQTNSALRCCQSRLFTWSASTTPETYGLSGISTSQGSPSLRS